MSAPRAVRIGGQTGAGDVVAGVCCRPPDEEEEVDEVFFRRLEESLQPQAWVLMSGFNHLAIRWENSVAGHDHHKRFLEWFEGNFMVEVMNEPTRGDALLDPQLKHREEQAENEKAGGSLVCRECKTVALKVLREVSKANSRITALNLRGAGVCLLRGEEYKDIV